MDILFAVNIIALLFSFFVAGAVLGALFAHAGTERDLSAREGACVSLIRALSSKNLPIVLMMLKRLPASAP